MSPPRRGLSFEEALATWSPPEDYEHLKELDDFERAPLNFIMGPRDQRRRDYLWYRARLEKMLFEKLSAAELLSSAIERTPDPLQPRILVHPSLYEANVSYDRLQRWIEAGDLRLCKVEIFSPEEWPDNVTAFPEWLSDFGVQARPPSCQSHAEGISGREAFRHDPSYRHVWLREEEFSLTPMQAEIVRALHEAALRGQPWLHVEELRKRAGFESEKLSHIFRRMPRWSELILSDRRGAYRLNL